MLKYNKLVSEKLKKKNSFLWKYFEKIPQDVWMDSQFVAFGSTEEGSISISCGHKFLSSNVYQLSPVEVNFSILFSSFIPKTFVHNLIAVCL